MSTLEAVLKSTQNLHGGKTIIPTCIVNNIRDFGTMRHTKSNKNAINRNWSYRNPNFALKTQVGKITKIRQSKYNENIWSTKRAALSQKVATQQPKPN